MPRLVAPLLLTLFLACTGAVGTQGPTGPKGASGLQGATGADGSLRIYGNGSAGAVDVTGELDVADPNLQYTDFTIESGGVLVLESGTVLRCTGAFTNHGTIYVIPSAKGGLNSVTGWNNQKHPILQAPDPGVALIAPGGGELNDSTNTLQGGLSGKGLTEAQARSVLRPGVRGGGGGMGGGNSYGSDGGGAAVILAKGTITNTGLINADGNSLSGGGGGGGVVILASATAISQSGTISARGGEGGASDIESGAGGGGGGGIVHLLAPSIDAGAGTIDVSGGAGGANTVDVTATLHTGGGGGGASGGNGGMGGSVAASTGAAGAAGQGSPGYALKTVADPTSLF